MEPEGDNHHHHPRGRGRSPRRHASPPHSRDASPNWSEVSDHSPPRLITPTPRRRPSLEEDEVVMPLARPGGGRRSPVRGGRRAGAGGEAEAEVGQPLVAARKKGVSGPAAAAAASGSVSRLEVLCLVVQVLAAGAALVQGVPLALVTAAWQHQGPDVCPLYVSRPPGFGVHWGNEDLAPCKAAAFLPMLVAALALTLAAAHACVLHVGRVAGRGGEGGGRAPPAPAPGSRVYAGVTVALVVVQVGVCLAAVLVLTEGFRQTCVSFDLALAWNETPKSCRRRLDERDDAYQLTATFGRLVTGLVGGWACVALTATLLVACTVRAGLCRLQLLCI